MIELLLELSMVGSFALAAIVLMSDGKRVSNRLFAAIAFCFGVWSLSILLFRMTADPHYALVYAKLYYLVSMVFSALLAIFALHYPREEVVSRRIIWTAATGGLALAACIILIDTFMVQSFTWESGQWVGHVNHPGYWLFTAYFVAFFLVALVTAFRKFFQYHGLERKRASYYAIGVGLTSIPGFIANLILPYFGDYHHIWIGPVASMIFLCMSGYSITRHRMLDIKAFLAKTAIYVVVIAAIVILYAALMYVFTALLLGNVISSSAMFFANIITALIIAVTFVPLRSWVMRVMNRFLHITRYDSQSLLNSVTKLSVEITDLDVLVSRTLMLLETAFRPRFVAVLFRDAVHHNVARGHLPKKLSDVKDIEEFVKSHRSDGISRGIGAVFALETSAQEIGYLMFGTEIDGRLYRREDERTMRLIASELSVAIQNIFRLEEIRSFARTLEKEVGAATKELRDSNNKLIEMDATKDEFVSMASHQLRTPLTSVKGYLSMVLEGDVGDIGASQRQLLQEAFNSSERMVHLIGDFLNVSRLQTGKFIVDPHSTDLAVVTRQEVEAMSVVASAHSSRVTYKAPKRFPVLYLDEGKMRQVIMNFIDNAVYYSPDGTTITVTLAIEDGDAVLRVTDKGMGVPEDVQQKLFTKFFRAENAKKQRPDGTGIGLFLAKKVIDAHDGQIVFSSQLGKGSTFGFRLPIARLSEPPAAPPDADKQKTAS